MKLRAASLIATFLAVIAPALAAPPNIVLIFTDDQGYQDVGCFGSPNIKTPNLDQLARDGMRFTDFYSMAPVCSASRAGLLTGCYPARVGITGVLFPRHDIGLNPEETTIAEVLKTKGYATACVGKWHLGHLKPFLPPNQGFDQYLGIPYSNDMDKAKGAKNNLDQSWINRDYDTWNVPLIRDLEVIERPANQITLTQRSTNEAVQFIEKSAGKKPFFLYMPYTMPHIPVFVSDEFYVKDPLQAYKVTIEEVDWSVGQVLKALEKTGVADNTLVVFTSDNGPWLSMKHHGGSALPLQKGKFTVYEGGMRVPCIMRWPGKIPANSSCGKVAAAFDLLPTFAAAAGASLPDRKIDGRDITSLMMGDPDASSPHQLYCFFKGKKVQAARWGNWKLHMPPPLKKKQREANPELVENPAQLYDLSTDIGESKNVAADHPELVKKIIAAARGINAEVNENARPPGSVKNL